MGLMHEQPPRLPTIVFSSVVRSTKKSESHGGVYLLDLETEKLTQHIDWDDPTIDFDTRGGDRGLRGIAFHDDLMYLAAAEQIFVYDRNFKLQRTITNRYLKHCHEINIGDDKLFLGSVGYDSILEYDLKQDRFTAGYCLRFAGWRRKLRWRKAGLRPWPAFTVYDPEKADGGPAPGDSSHPSFPRWADGRLYICGGGLGHLYAVEGRKLRRAARVQYESHNAQLFRDGVLYNHSPTHRMVFASRRGRIRQTWDVPRYDPEALEYANVPRDHAYQGFCRGIAIAGPNLIIQGSSPATVNLFQLDPPKLVKSINVTMDVRNSIHGLEIWPFAEVPEGLAARDAGEQAASR
jgi:hypothetical protein